MNYYKRGELPHKSAFLVGPMQGAIIKDGKYVADVFSDDGPLFAAAPDMLAALELIDAYIESPEDGLSIENIQRIRATIAKAKGESK